MLARTVHILALLVAGTGVSAVPLFNGCHSNTPAGAQEAEAADAKKACATYLFPADRVVGRRAHVWLRLEDEGVCGMPYLAHAWRISQEIDPFPQLLAATSEERSSKERSPLTFLHERSSPSGNRRIVAAGPLNLTHLGEGSFVTRVRLFTVDGPMPDSEVFKIGMNVAIRYAGCEAHTVSPAGEVKVYAAQPDPHDTSRFVYPFEFNGARGRVIAQLDDDDSFTVSVEPLPLRCAGCG